MSQKIDASDPGRAAHVAAAAAILYARTSGYKAENALREARQEYPAYGEEAFEILVQQFYDEIGVNT